MIRISMPIIGEEEERRILEVLRSGWLAHGPVVEEFERRFAKYIGVDHALAVVNGTVALDLALKALGIGPGDEVIVPSFTFIATANAVLMQGARPVFADIELETYNIDPDDVVNKITSRTRAIIAVHLYGHPANMDVLSEIAEDHHLYLVEDAAQAHGAAIRGRRVGGIGDIAAFSFYATKNLTTGEGGMVTTNSPALAYRVSMLRNHGQEGKYNHVTLGGNYRMTSIQAAMGLAQLEKLDRLNEARRRNAERLTQGLSRIRGIKTPTVKPGYTHVWHQYVVWVGEEYPLTRDQLREKLNEKGVETAVHYPRPVHLQPLYRSLGYPPDICPNSVEASRHVLSLPVHPGLTESDVDTIVNAVIEVTEEAEER